MKQILPFKKIINKKMQGPPTFTLFISFHFLSFLSPFSKHNQKKRNVGTTHPAPHSLFFSFLCHTLVLLSLSLSPHLKPHALFSLSLSHFDSSHTILSSTSLLPLSLSAFCFHAPPAQMGSISLLSLFKNRKEKKKNFRPKCAFQLKIITVHFDGLDKPLLIYLGY